jgi:hypothetical protein
MVVGSGIGGRVLSGDVVGQGNFLGHVRKYNA